jgi:hypothetical protein
MGNGVELGFEIAIGFVLFIVVCVIGIVVLGLLVRIPIWFCEAVAKEWKWRTSKEGIAYFKEKYFHVTVAIAFFFILLLIASLFTR